MMINSIEVGEKVIEPNEFRKPLILISIFLKIIIKNKKYLGFHQVFASAFIFYTIPFSMVLT